MPFEPDVLAKHSRPRPSNMPRSSSRDAAALDDRRRRAGIEVEGDERRALGVVGQRQRGVQLEIGEVGQPHERGLVVGQDVVDRPHARGLNPVGTVRWRVLLVEELRVDAVGVALERQRAALDVRQDGRRDAREVVDDVALGEAGLGIEDLVEVRELHLAPADLGQDRVGLLAHDELRRLVVAQALVGGRAQLAAVGPLPELDLGHQLRIGEHGAARDLGAARREGRVLALEGAQHLGQAIELGLGEARADAPDMAQRAVVLAHARRAARRCARGACRRRAPSRRRPPPDATCS